MATNRSLRSLNRLLGIGREAVDFLLKSGTLQEVGDELVTEIRNRTRQGFGIAKDNAKPKKLAKLKPFTIEARKRLQELGELHEETTPDKSNLTMTGHMLNSLIARSKQGRIEILFEDSFAKKKAEWAHLGAANRKPRPFMFLTKGERAKAIRLLEEASDKYIAGRLG